MSDPAYNVTLQYILDVPPHGNVELYSRPSPLAAITFAVITLFTSIAPTTVVLNGASDLHVGQSNVALEALSVAGTGTVTGGGGGTVTGTLSQTLANATLAGTGTVLVSGTASPTLGTLTLAGTGGVLVQGTLAQTLGALTVAGTATHPVLGTLASTLGDVSLAGTGGVLDTGSLSSTLGAVTLAATGTVKSDATGLNVIFKVPGVIRTIPAGQVNRSAIVASRFTPVLSGPITRSTDTKPIYRRQVV